VVRDAITGSRMQDIPMNRDLDYTISYNEGRLIFAQPVPSMVTASWHLDHEASGVLDGNPVFVEVEYDFNATSNDDAQASFGAQIRHHVSDWLTVGVGVVDEDRSQQLGGGAHYRLAGAEARITLPGKTRVEMEVAWSETEDAEHYASYDGGISWGRIGTAALDANGNTNWEEASGMAAKMKVKGDVMAWFGASVEYTETSDKGSRPADLFGKNKSGAGLVGEPVETAPEDFEAIPDPVLEPSATALIPETVGESADELSLSDIPVDGVALAAEGEGGEVQSSEEDSDTKKAEAEAGPFQLRIPFSLYAHYQDPGFNSGLNVMEQGQSKVGGQVKVMLTPNDSLRLRHDGVWSTVFVQDNERKVNRQMSVLGYEHKTDLWTAGAEFGNSFLSDDTMQHLTETLAAFGSYKLSPRLVLTGEQEVALLGDTVSTGTATDRFVTTVGAKYQLAERLWLTATEALRWSGTNSTQIGLRTQVGKDLSFYATERLTTTDGRTLGTTVVGGESQAIPGSRSYAEYQMDSLATGKTGRAVFGMDNRWTLIEGLKLDLAYERAQLLGNSASTGSTGTSPLNASTTGFGSSPLSANQQFAASSYAASGVFPVGVASRDAFSIGLELLRYKTFKVTSRFEMRYDRADESLAQEDSAGLMDRLVLFGKLGGDARIDRYLVFLMRLQAATVQNMDRKDIEDNQFGFSESQFADLSMGVALRPQHSNRVAGLAKWTRRYERRPLDTTLTHFQLEVSDVLSIEQALEVGFGFQVVGKFAAKLFTVEDSAGDDANGVEQRTFARSTTYLALGRVNYHLLEILDAAAEYRWLYNDLAAQQEHGALLEIAWKPLKYVSVGLGYNFTRFSDDLLASPDRDYHGPYMRVTGQY
ncbi:hypothetical protein KAI87_16485, partial [Myxococcota bacterium]|nr:hypothetical protein [Myxococcota bacterium]